MLEASSSSDFAAATEAWRFDEVSRFVLVKFAKPGGTSTLTL